jgi:uncharacterized membrane protein
VSGLLIGAALVLLGAALLWIAWAGSQHRLAPNAVVGIRLPATRRSEAAWYAAHDAAAGPFGLGGGVACACGVATMFTGFDVIGVVLVIVGLAAATTATGVATAVGLRAANAA